MATWLRTGTAAVTNGNVVVAFTGVDLIAASIRAGDAFHAPDGRVYEIASVDAAGQASLAQGYLGATASGQAYAIQPTRGVVTQLYNSVQTLVDSVQAQADGILSGRFPGGTAGAPSFTNTGDTDTGLFFPAADTLAVVTGGVEQMRVAPDGKVGIKNQSPETDLHIGGLEAHLRIGQALAGAGIDIKNRVTAIPATGVSATIGWLDSVPGFGAGSLLLGSRPGVGKVVLSASGSADTVVDNNGRLGIGTTVPSSLLHIASGPGAFLTLGDKATRHKSLKWEAVSPFDTLVIESKADDGGWRGAIDMRIGHNNGTPFSAITAKSTTGGVPFVGINNPNPDDVLHVKGTVNNSGLTVEYGSGSPVLTLKGNSASSSNIFFSDEHGDMGKIRYVHGYVNGTTDAMEFYTNGQLRMTLDSNGKVLIGATGGAGRLTVIGDSNTYTALMRGTNGGQNLTLQSTTDTGNAVHFLAPDGSSAGSIGHTLTSVNYNTSSDERLKTNIAAANDAGSLIDAIDVRQFDWRVNDQHQDYGWIAQELVEVFPDAVTKGETDDDMWSVDNSKLVPLMMKELQSLRARVAHLEAA